MSCYNIDIKTQICRHFPSQNPFTSTSRSEQFSRTFEIPEKLTPNDQQLFSFSDEAHWMNGYVSLRVKIKSMWFGAACSLLRDSILGPFYFYWLWFQMAMLYSWQQSSLLIPSTFARDKSVIKALFSMPVTGFLFYIQ